MTRLAGTAAAGTLGAMTPGDTLTRLAADLAAFEDPQERLAFVVDRVRRVPPLSAAERIDAHRVTGCISIVWLTGREEGGRWTFRADADSPVVRGLLLLLQVTRMMVMMAMMLPEMELTPVATQLP